MKTFLITLLGALGCSLAAAAESPVPVYSWTWTTEGATSSASGWNELFSYTEGNDYATYGAGHRAYNAGISGISGSFTFSMDIRKPSANTSWRALLSLYSNNSKSGSNHSMQLQMNDQKQFVLFTGGIDESIPFGESSGSAGKSLLCENLTYSSLQKDEWTNLAIVQDLDAHTLSVYVDNELAASVDSWNPTTPALTGMQFGTAFGSTRTWDGTMEVNNIRLYNQVVLPSSAVPEPATATLSLLALAGLAARRRRK